VSGDASCADHNIAWKMRYNLRLDHVPAGVADNGKDDNIIYDFTNGVSASGSATRVLCRGDGDRRSATPDPSDRTLSPNAEAGEKRRSSPPRL